MARLMRILFDHHASGRRSPPELYAEFEELVERLHGLDGQAFAAAIGQLGSVLYYYARRVAEWGERPFGEVLVFLDLAANRKT